MEKSFFVLNLLPIFFIIIFFFLFFIIIDVSESITDTMGHMKDSIVSTVSNVGHGIEDIFHQKKTQAVETIQEETNEMTEAINNEMDAVKDMPVNVLNSIDENIEDVKDDLLKKAKSFSDDTEEMADKLMKETEDIVNDTINVGNDTIDMVNDNIDMTKESVETSIEKFKTELGDIHESRKDLKTPGSIISFKTGSPEPELQRIHNDEIRRTPTPEPTLSEMMKLPPIDNKGLTME